MDKSPAKPQETADGELIEEINQIKSIALGKEGPTCQVCGERILPGQTVVAYFYRSAGTPLYKVGYCLCDTHKGEPGRYRRGKRELVVIGRVGECIDHSLQTSWPVPLAPELVAVSDSESTTAKTYISLGDDRRDTAPTSRGGNQSTPPSDANTAAGEGNQEVYDVCYPHSETSGKDAVDDSTQNESDDKTPPPPWTDDVWEPDR